MSIIVELPGRRELILPIEPGTDNVAALAEQVCQATSLPLPGGEPCPPEALAFYTAGAEPVDPEQFLAGDERVRVAVKPEWGMRGVTAFGRLLITAVQKGEEPLLDELLEKQGITCGDDVVWLFEAAAESGRLELVREMVHQRDAVPRDVDDGLLTYVAPSAREGARECAWLAFGKNSNWRLADRLAEQGLDLMADVGGGVPMAKAMRTLGGLEKLLMHARNVKEGIVATPWLGRAVPRRYRWDKDFMIMVMKLTGPTLQYLPTHLRGDRDVVKAAISNHPHSIKFATDELRDDDELVMLTVCSAENASGLALQHASARLRGIKTVVLPAVTRSGKALQWASEAMRDDKDVVLAAVTNDGNALQYAGAALRRDRDVVSIAVANTRVRKTAAGKVIKG